jgi:hypothetical protein
MKRVIKNYTNITPMHIELIAKAFPEGFGDDDLQVLSMPNGKYLRALEVKTEDTIYLFRIDDEMIEVLETPQTRATTMPRKKPNVLRAAMTRTLETMTTMTTTIPQTIVTRTATTKNTDALRGGGNE